MDLYKELGVSKSASQEEIRKAYKKLAMKHHPDRGGDSETLSKINAAYTVLKDPQKRAQYDNPQPHFGGGRSGGFYSQRADFNSMFEEFFRSGQGGFEYRPQKQQIAIQVFLSLKDCYTGKTIETGYTTPTGQYEQINVEIPAGVTHGDVVRVNGTGSQTQSDVQLVIRVKPEHGWDIHGRDLLTSVVLNVFDMAAGTSVNIETPNDEHLKLKIPPGTQPDNVFLIRGYGLPHPNSPNKGNIHVKLNPFVPTVTDSELKAKLEEVKNGIIENAQ